MSDRNDSKHFEPTVNDIRIASSEDIYFCHTDN